MARQNHGPLSRAKGKLGGVVYQQYEGMQISREYQPVVKNPQTTKQVTNRAKFKLSSQIVAQFKEVISARLSKLSIYERMRRAAAVNAIFRVIDDGEPESPVALINSVIGALNAKSVSAIVAPEFTVSSNELKVNAEEGSTIIVVTCAYDATKGNLVNRLIDEFEATSTARTVITKDTNRNVSIAVSLTANTDDGRATISNITASSNSWQNEIARAVVAGDIEISNMAGYVLEPQA